MAAALCASYIGGSINFAATAAALGLAPGPLLAGAMAADNIAMALYLAVVSSWRVDAPQPPAAAASLDGADALTISNRPPAGLPAAALQAAPAPSATAAAAAADAGSWRSAAMALPAAAVACWAGSRLAKAVGFAGGDLAFMAVVATAIAAAASATAARRGSGGGLSTSPFVGALSFCCTALLDALPHDMHGLSIYALQQGELCFFLAGSSRLGGVLMLPFFATIGAAAGSLHVLPGVGWMFAFIAVQLVTHVVVSIAGGRLFRLPMEAVLTASNANVGGPATAAATASARGWDHMFQPAVLTGSLGCACIHKTARAALLLVISSPHHGPS